MKRILEYVMPMTIRSSCQADLELLYRCFSDESDDPARNLELQENGEGLYLVFWNAGTPLGHLFLRWAGSHEVPRIRDRYPVAANINCCPALDDHWVCPEYRSQGIGTQLILEAERITQMSGYLQVCLTVDIDNKRARALYERLGYADLGIGPFHTSGTYTNADGQEVPWDNGTQLLLMKRLYVKD